MDRIKIKKLVKWLKKAENAIAFTGAGMSTESGLADFRSENGLWEKFDPKELATKNAFKNNYSEFSSFYKFRLESILSCSPHAGHEILARWERKGLLKGVITQNVDGFHQKAGSQNVMELHGALHKFYCDNCRQEKDSESFKNKEFNCKYCGGKIRPAVVLFGESLPQKEWEQAFYLVEKADLMLVIGTSLEVSPANQLPLSFWGQGPLVLINKDKTPFSKKFDLHLPGSAGEILLEIDNLMS